MSLQIIYWIYMYKNDLALNNQTKPKQAKFKQPWVCSIFWWVTTSEEQQPENCVRLTAKLSDQ